MTRAITIKLSERTYEQLKRTAEISERPMEEIVEQSLSHSLPPLLEDVPAEYQRDVYPLLQMDREALQREVARVFDRELWATYEGLLEKKKTEGLTEEEAARLEQLRREADVLMLRKGYAAVLLKRRGYQVPTRPAFSYNLLECSVSQATVEVRE
jgi:hypothetical protein